MLWRAGGMVAGAGSCLAGILGIRPAIRMRKHRLEIMKGRLGAARIVRLTFGLGFLGTACL